MPSPFRATSPVYGWHSLRIGPDSNRHLSPGRMTVRMSACPYHTADPLLAGDSERDVGFEIRRCVRGLLDRIHVRYVHHFLAVVFALDDLDSNA